MKAELMDRRRETYALRLAGHSYRSIAEKLNVSVGTAHEDCKIAEEHFSDLALRQEIVREGLMALHGKLNGMLIQTLQRQLEEGQLVTELDRDGNIVKITRKNYPAPQIAAELGRNLQRMAGLAGLDTAPVEGGSSSNTTIVLSQPSDAVSFQDRWKTAAPATAGAVDVSATSASDEPSHAPSLESAAPCNSEVLDVTVTTAPADPHASPVEPPAPAALPDPSPAPSPRRSRRRPQEHTVEISPELRQAFARAKQQAAHPPEPPLQLL